VKECIFCKIASKEIPATIIEETEEMIVIEDLNPQAPVHLLILPKTHFETIIDCEDSDFLGRMLAMASRLAVSMDIAENGFRTVINTRKDGGQTVFHLHMHLLAGRHLSGWMGGSWKKN